MNIIEALEARPELEQMRERHNIDKERFIKGIIFAEFIIQGENGTNSYKWAFQCDEQSARMNASTLRNTKWMQDLIVNLRPDDNTLYFGEIRQIIRKGMAIIDNPNSEDKDIISAMNALAKYVKISKPVIHVDEVAANDAMKAIGNLVQGIAQLSEAGKMIDKHGTIIDVPVLE